jgi:tRNA A-37 threonylcarbamoyl transferase component Bud32
MKKKSTFQVRIKEAKPIAEEICKTYRHSEIAKLLLEKSSIEEIKLITKTEVLDACKPEVCDAALIVVCATIVDDPKAACRLVHKGQLQ